MGKVAYKDAVYKIGATRATLATIGAYDFSHSGQAEMLDVSDSASGDHKEYIAGMFEDTFSFAKWVDDAETPYMRGDSVYFQVTLGSEVFGANCVVEQSNIEVQSGNAARWNYTLRAVGDIDGL